MPNCTRCPVLTYGYEDQPTRRPVAITPWSRSIGQCFLCVDRDGIQRAIGLIILVAAESPLYPAQPSAAHRLGGTANHAGDSKRELELPPPERHHRHLGRLQASDRTATEIRPVLGITRRSCSALCPRPTNGPTTHPTFAPSRSSTTARASSPPPARAASNPGSTTTSARAIAHTDSSPSTRTACARCRSTSPDIQPRATARSQGQHHRDARTTRHHRRRAPSPCRRRRRHLSPGRQARRRARPEGARPRSATRTKPPLL